MTEADGAGTLDGGLGADVLDSDAGADLFLFGFALGVGTVDPCVDFDPPARMAPCPSMPMGWAARRRCASPPCRPIWR
ncbi:MAG: hypothetical protein N3D18_03370 [Roseococcus sp.]|nr:hypothetical protein [Roseococcus sp.]